MLGLFNRNHTKSTEVTVSNRTIIRIILLVIVSFIMILAAKKASHALVLVFTAFFLALALNSPVHWLAVNIPGKRRGSRRLATAISFLIVVALMTLFIATIIPPLVRQTDSFIHAAPGLVKDVHNQNSGLGNFVRKYHLVGEVNNFSSQLGSRLQRLSGSAFSTITKITGSIFSMLAILVMTFMMLVEGPAWVRTFRRLLPSDHREHADLLARDMYKVIKGYVNGQVLMAAIASVIIIIPVLILNISYPVALLVVVFICALIPLVGHAIGAAIVTIVSLFHSPLDALIILIYYVLYMQIEAYVIQPRIQSNTTNMTPLLIIVAVIIGVSFDGLLGGLIAIPVAGCLRIVILDYLNSHNLFEEDLSSETK